MDAADLPYVDEHSIAIEATADAAWNALLRVVEGSFSSGASSAGARLLGCADTVASGLARLRQAQSCPAFTSRQLSRRGSWGLPAATASPTTR